MVLSKLIAAVGVFAPVFGLRAAANTSQSLASASPDCHCGNVARCCEKDSDRIDWVRCCLWASIFDRDHSPYKCCDTDSPPDPDEDKGKHVQVHVGVEY